MSGRKLGRGLDMLIHRKPRELADPEPRPPSTLDTEASSSVESESEPPFEVVEVDPRAVQPNPDQPRKEFDEKELELLKVSISQEGLLQPVLVRRVGEGFQLIAGERRLRAARELDLQRIPAIVAELEDDRLLEMALIENIQREDLNPIEVARAYQQLMSVKGWTQEAVARSLGISRSGVANALRLLELPQAMQRALVHQHISMGHAKVLLSVEDSEEQRQLFERIAEERLSVRELEDAREVGPATPPGNDGSPQPPRKRAPRRSARIASLEEELSRAVGTRVTIAEAAGKGTKGRIRIEFYSADDFERIRGLLLGKAK